MDVTSHLRGGRCAAVELVRCRRGTQPDSRSKDVAACRGSQCSESRGTAGEKGRRGVRGWLCPGESRAQGIWFGHLPHGIATLGGWFEIIPTRTWRRRERARFSHLLHCDILGDGGGGGGEVGASV